MKCAIIRWWMDEYIDGVLPEKRAQWVAHHLRHCAACRQELAWRHSLHAMLHRSAVSASSREMWLDFQRRLSQRSSPAPVRRAGWWRWGAASAAVAAAVVIGVVWWNGYRSVPKEAVQPTPLSGQQLASEREAVKPLVAGETESGAASSSTPTRPSSSKSVRWVRVAPKPVAPMQVRVVANLQGQARRSVTTPPQVLASVAYAEVRDEHGALLAKVMLQTTFDEAGKPTAILIEADTPAVEVDNDETPRDGSDNHDDTRGSAGSPTPTASTRLGLPD
jgi:cytoskeletal protein RodZ